MYFRPRFRIRCLRDWICLLSALTLISFLLTYRVPPLPSPSFFEADTTSSIKRSILTQTSNEDALSSTRRRLQRILFEIEQKSLTRWNKSAVKIVEFRGHKSIITRDMSTYRLVLEEHGFLLNIPQQYDENATYVNPGAQPHLIICFTFADSLSCWNRGEYGLKMNKLPALRSNVWQRETVCYSHKMNSSCFILPFDYQSFFNSLTASSNWLIQFHSEEGWKVYTAEELTKRSQQLSQARAIIQPFPSSVLTILGHPISVRLYILITSLLPIRAYLHTQGIVYHRQLDGNRSLRKIPSQVWNLDQLWQHLRTERGPDYVNVVINRLMTALVPPLLTLEAALPKKDIRERRCRSCFQLFGFDAIFNSTLHPFIVELNGQPDMRKTDNQMVNSIKRRTLSDAISLVSASDRVSSLVAHTLSNMEPRNFGILGVNCRVTYDFCLTSDDLSILMDSQRENFNKRGFLRLYPRDGETDDITRDILQRIKNLSFYRDDVGDEASETQTVQAEDYRLSRCSEDPASKPLISDIQIAPEIRLRPPFSPFVTEYVSSIPYHQLVIRVWANCQYCRCEVRLDEKNGPSSATNYTLGVGENKILLLVLDKSHSKPWLVNTYTLTIHRLPLIHGESPFDPTGEHQVCSLIQECEMKISSEEKCDVQVDKSNVQDWITYMAHVVSLPLCNSGDAPGRWVLPCKSCRVRKSCYWREAVWQPYSCQHALFTRTSLSKCLEGKKLLFIGDSTNRGIMHYLMERVNGSLMEWDKTHDIRIVSNINNGKTSVAFAYYPQFWLPSEQRPVFDKALYQLIQRSRPLDNTTDTILVVGGVQWLATQHLLMLLRVLRVERLNGIRLVLKTLGSGFHQAVDGIRSLSLDEHQKLLQHNIGMANFAKHYNFEVVDTFNITVARYKDFLQGKCACHFHKVVKIPYPETTWRKQRAKSHRISRYHVEGTINAIYSEILLSRICSNVTDT